MFKHTADQLEFMEVIMRKINVWLLSILLTLISSIFVGAYTHESKSVTMDGKRYILHRFVFNKAEIDEIAGSYRKAQGYSNGMVQTIWKLRDGSGANLGKFVGRVALGDRLYRMAKESKKDGWKEMGIQIRSRNDKEGKWALEFLDEVAKQWKKLVGK